MGTLASNHIGGSKHKTDTVCSRFSLSLLYENGCLEKKVIQSLSTTPRFDAHDSQSNHHADLDCLGCGHILLSGFPTVFLLLSLPLEAFHLFSSCLDSLRSQSGGQLEVVNLPGFLVRSPSMLSNTVQSASFCNTEGAHPRRRDTRASTMYPKCYTMLHGSRNAFSQWT